VDRIFCPEVEVNSLFFIDGPSDGKRQTFITPGLAVGGFTYGIVWVLRLVADFRLPPRNTIKTITMEFSRCAFHSDGRKIAPVLARSHDLEIGATSFLVIFQRLADFRSYGGPFQE